MMLCSLMNVSLEQVTYDGKACLISEHVTKRHRGAVLIELYPRYISLKAR